MQQNPSSDSDRCSFSQETFCRLLNPKLHYSFLTSPWHF